MPINSRQKGKRVELLFAKWMTEMFPWMALRRAQQYKGTQDSADIESEHEEVNEIFHFECKGVERLNVYETMDKLIDEAGRKKVPILLWKRNRKEPLLVIPMRDLPTLAYEIVERDGNYYKAVNATTKGTK